MEKKQKQPICIDLFDNEEESLEDDPQKEEQENSRFDQIYSLNFREDSSSSDIIEECPQTSDLRQPSRQRRGNQIFQGFADEEGTELDQVWFQQACKNEKVEEEENDIRGRKKQSKAQEMSKTSNDTFPVFKAKKRTAETRKIFEKQELLELKKYFEIMYNQEDDEDKLTFEECAQRPKITTRQLANKYKCCLPAIATLYKQWRYDPTMSKQLSRFDRIYTWSLAGRPMKQMQAQVQTAKRLGQLIEILSQNPFLSQTEMLQVLKQMDPLGNNVIQKSHVIRLLRYGDFRKKKVGLVRRQRNSAQNIELRRQFSLKLQEYIEMNVPICFLDQLIIHEHFDKEFGWVRGDTEIIFDPINKIDSSILVLGLFSIEGNLLWDVKYGNYSRPQFKVTISRFLKAVNQSKKRGVIVVNPLSYRQMNYIYEIAQSVSWQVLSLPPQGLQLNPLFMYYIDLKDMLKKFKFTDVQSLFGDVVACLKEKDGCKTGKKYIDRMQGYMIKAIARQPF